MTIYKIGDTELILEEIFSVSDRYGIDANRICIDVHSKNGVKVVCTIKAKGDEIKGHADGHDWKFIDRVEHEIEEFKNEWHYSIQYK